VALRNPRAAYAPTVSRRNPAQAVLPSGRIQRKDLSAMTCRDEVLDCARLIVTQKGENRFTIQEILRCMRARGTRYKESTIRTHVTSRMCSDAPKHHAVKYDDFERIGEGVYSLRNQAEV